MNTIAPFVAVALYTPGSRAQPWTWLQELEDIMGRDADQMHEMTASGPIVEPITLRPEDSCVVDGHHRVLVALLRGDTQIPYQWSSDIDD